MKESEYIAICNLTYARQAEYALREMHVEEGGEDWRRRGEAINWLYHYCLAIWDAVGDVEEG